MSRLQRFAFLACLLIGTPAWAEDWVVARVSGRAWLVAENAPATALTAGMKVPDGLTVSTGPRSRVRLERGAQTMVVGPDAVLSPRHSFWTGTTILQPKGRIEFEVEKRDVKHFHVETPYLAAIVKGTRFSVAVSRRGASVAVSRGLVEVSDFVTGEVADLGPGLSAQVTAPGGTPGLQLGGAGALPQVQQGAPRSSQIQGGIGTAPAAGASAALGGSGFSWGGLFGDDTSAGASAGALGSGASIGASVDAGGGSTGAGSLGSGSASAGGSLGGGVSAGAGGSLGGSGGASVGASVDAGGSIGASVGASIGGGSIGAGVGASIGGGSVGVGASLGGGGLGGALGGLGDTVGGSLGGVGDAIGGR